MSGPDSIALAQVPAGLSNCYIDILMKESGPKQGEQQVSQVGARALAESRVAIKRSQTKLTTRSSSSSRGRSGR